MNLNTGLATAAVVTAFVAGVTVGHFLSGSGNSDGRTGNSDGKSLAVPPSSSTAKGHSKNRVSFTGDGASTLRSRSPPPPPLKNVEPESPPAVIKVSSVNSEDSKEKPNEDQEETDQFAETDELPPMKSPRTQSAAALERAQSRLVYSSKEHNEDKADETYSLVPEVKLRELFYKVAGENHTVNLPQFLNLLDELDVHFAPAESDRIFKQLDAEGRGRINFFQFLTGVNCRKLLKVIVGNYFFKSKFEIPSNYDYTKPSHENYRKDDQFFVGEFADIRKTRDYSYHNNFTEERQLWQDDVIRNVVIRTERQARPWILFTCGPMGAGKSFALSWMSQHGFFPLENIVHIDPDRFKTIMPEWAGYIKTDPASAGSHTHRESSFMVEIAQECALRRSQHIWVDGSLRDGKWYAQVFEDLRFRFPQYRIAIFYVHASEAAVRKRIAMRAETTGRAIPESLIKASLESPDHSLAILTPKSDFVARISTELPIPALEAFEYVDCSGCWEIVRKRFGQLHPSSNEFPRSLAPLYLQRTTFDSGFILISESEKEKLTEFSNTAAIKISVDLKFFSQHEALKGLEHLLCGTDIMCSPAHPINIDEENRQLGLIPPEAHYFVFCYPSDFIAVDNLKLHGIDIRDPHVSFFMIGGFVYFDLHDNIVAVNALSAGAQKFLLQFGPAEHLPLEAVTAIGRNRWHAVTLPHMRQKGATYFAWILPGEKVRHSGVPSSPNAYRRLTRYGGFAYLFHEFENFTDDQSAMDCFFPILS
jgi:hypothetical protein